jgi:hypothetical protein
MLYEFSRTELLMGRNRYKRRTIAEWQYLCIGGVGTFAVSKG